VMFHVESRAHDVARGGRGGTLTARCG